MSLVRSVGLVKRSRAGSYLNGTWVDGEALDTPFRGTVQPPSGETMRVLPEGTGKSDVIEVIAPRDMTFFVADPLTQVPSDRLVWRNVEYVITAAVLMDNGLLPHWELIAQKPPEGAA